MNGYPIVVDCGSFTCKAGYANEDAPRAIFPSFTSRKRNKNKQKRIICGEYALQSSNLGHLSSPFDARFISDWDELQHVFYHTFFNELQQSPEDFPILLTEPPLNPKKHRERLTEMMFDVFNVPATYIAITSTLSLYSSGRTTGVVFESGYETSFSVPIYEGYALPHAMDRLDYGGKDVTSRLKSETRYSSKNSKIIENSILDSLKKEYCYIALDPDDPKEKLSLKDKPQFKLPDGSLINAGIYLFEAPEMLFWSGGVHESIYGAIMRCDVDIRKDMYSNIILSGGNTMFKGFADRLNKEMVALAPAGIHIRVIAPPERDSSTWIGGSILASLQTFQDMWITREEYDDQGLGILSY
eukprot:snap_masked-scaffold_131-processed-gene-0.6-mRNA-1 protein AED:0.03 eAED:0.03 QI:0/0/0/0.5/1/1/2/0/355